MEEAQVSRPRFEWVVQFCADGGQMCVPGVRVFPDTPEGRAAAMAFAGSDPHTCWAYGRKPPMLCVPAGTVENDGAIYPAVANLGRRL
jgi:hypothetical protein